jgi:hypothetical protein
MLRFDEIMSQLSNTTVCTAVKVFPAKYYLQNINTSKWDNLNFFQIESNVKEG